MQENIVLVTGGFDPVHSGHLTLFHEARKLGDKLIVGVNSDDWLARKKGRSFMPINERVSIIQNLKMVDEALLFDDTDGSAKQAIANVRRLFPTAKIIFANGGDRTKDNIPEMDVTDKNLEFVFGVGGEQKMNSSRWILEEWKAPKTERLWGYYRVLHENTGVKVKELTVNPGAKLSLQRHFKRAEIWFVSEGTGQVKLSFNDDCRITFGVDLPHFMQYNIPEKVWHQLINPTDKPLKIVEIQYGEDCEEEDIERYEQNLQARKTESKT